MFFTGVLMKEQLVMSNIVVGPRLYKQLPENFFFQNKLPWTMKAKGVNAQGYNQ